MKALVVIDIQKEYTTPGRRFHIQNIDRSLENARAMLNLARESGWPIVHVKHLQEGEVFNPTSEMSGFVDGFSPQEGETLAVKSNISSFSSPAFAQFAAAHAKNEFVIVGYGTTMCCLATIVDGYSRGYKFSIVGDACAARATAEFSEQSMHEHALKILEPFSKVTTLEAEETYFTPVE
ncbi:isochorismatase family protein [Herbaspirillum chlorophenolicum]|jgi:nicotinamidase-related amidase|uniref:Isochorismatase family protein n=1 Tax=Herbaspirillum chlorophenolicum TaxID=211589 RepID=A0ABW8EVB5_9BURK|nr:isochorismatase family protein [Herbaspirillum chlorophenolicum]